MKLHWATKDGGPKSHVWCWGIESKRFGTIFLLKMTQGSREAFHTHTFNSVSWILRGALREKHLNGKVMYYLPFRTIRTYRETFHQVQGLPPVTWALTIRGPWEPVWREFTEEGRFIALTHGRVEI